MGNFEERVQSIVSKKTDELLELFQDSEDRTRDLEDKISSLLPLIGLTKDIKTEIARIEKNLVPGNDGDEGDDEEDSPQNNEPPKGEDITDMMEMLEYLSQHLLSDKTVDQLLLDGPPGLPMIINPKGSGRYKGFSAKDAFKLLYHVWKWLKDMKQNLRDGLNEALRNASLDGAKSQLDYINQTVNKIHEVLTRDIKDSLSDISKAIQTCCSQTSATLTDLGNQLEGISKKIDLLDPATTADKDLSLQTKTKAILSEIQSIRGLL